MLHFIWSGEIASPPTAMLSPGCDGRQVLKGNVFGFNITNKSQEILKKKSCMVEFPDYLYNG
jgi:hypothetical protein